MAEAEQVSYVLDVAEMDGNTIKLYSPRDVLLREKQIKVHLDRRDWDALGRPGFLHVTVTASPVNPYEITA